MPQPVTTLIELLQWRVLQDPQRPAYTFLENGEIAAAHITYGELDQRARAIAAVLQQKCRMGERVLLLYPAGIDYIAAFFGCLYANLIAIPLPCPRFNRVDARFQAVVANAQPTAALTTDTLLARFGDQLRSAPGLRPSSWLASDQVPDDAADQWQVPTVSARTIAYLQYTSGSTTTPRGVMVSHANLLHNMADIAWALQQTAQSVMISWLPHFHDMGLIYGILNPLYVGFPCYLMSPSAFIQRPIRWLQAISSYRATHSAGPNFAYDLCVRKITPAHCETIELSTWAAAVNGSEPVQQATMEQFAAAFAPYGFRRSAFCPAYGLAESTLKVTVTLAQRAPVFLDVRASALEQNRVDCAPKLGEQTRTLVGCGEAASDARIVIVQPGTGQECGPDEVGEIWLASPSVTQGYWGQPEETAHTFHATFAGSRAGPFLRTGDLGFLREDELFVTGRLKDLIIIRGRNYYPQDIEITAAQCHPLLRASGGAAFSIDCGQGERLVVVHEVERQGRTIDTHELAISMRHAIAEAHEIQLYALALIKPGSIPKTSSGKVQHGLCRERFLAGTLDLIGSCVFEEHAESELDDELTREEVLVAAPAARQRLLEAYVRRQAAQLLRIDPAALGGAQQPDNLGIDSLVAAELANRIEAQFQVVLPMTQVLELDSVVGLAAAIVGHLKRSPAFAPAVPAAVPPDEGEREHPLSAGQRALWFLHQLAPESAAYNIASLICIHGDLRIPELHAAFQAIVDRHSTLRTTFHALRGEPVQREHDRLEVYFQVQEATEWSEASLQARLVAEAHRPFDLEHGPLLRILLFARAPQEHVLLLVMHHIVSDFWSVTVLLSEIDRLYTAACAGEPLSLPPPRATYQDHIRRQHTLLTGPEGARHRDYWEHQLAGPLPTLNLPTDWPRPPVQTYRGAVRNFCIDSGLAGQIKALGTAHRATLYMTLLAAFQALLARYTGQSDLLITSPTSGRSRAEFATLIGYFVNPVVIRARLDRATTFVALLEQARQTALEAFSHQDYPFVTLVEHLQPKRDASQTPLAQVLFGFQKAQPGADERLAAFALGKAGVQLSIGGLCFESLPIAWRIAQFDLSLLIAEIDGELVASLKYNTDLFEATTVARMTAHFETVLRGIIADPARPIARLPLLTEMERHQLLAWNATTVDRPAGRCLHQLFEDQAARTPDAPALMFDGRQLTYRELNRRANQIAHALRRRGVGAESRVGICMERSLEMIVALMGVLKAGGAYLPLDPAYPVERLQWMLADTQAQVVLIQAHLQAQFARAAIEVICLNTAVAGSEPEHNPPSWTEPANLAYVIYTSGSSGKPKGVLIEHRSIVNYVFGVLDCLNLPAGAHFMMVSTFAADLGNTVLFPSLITGGCLHIVPQAWTFDGHALMAYCDWHPIDCLKIVPSHFSALLQAVPTPARLMPRRRLVLGGEPSHWEWVQELRSLAPSCGILNHYGPTEATVGALTYQINDLPSEQRFSTAPLGRPLANTQVYLLDAQLQPVPAGVRGELYIGGDGVARGYLGCPDLTAERFIPNPFAGIEDRRLKIEDSSLDASETLSSILDPRSSGGERLYKTGDLGCRRPDGTIEILGRVDLQVKIRGFRVEPGEIEAALTEHPHVNAAVVLGREGMPGDRRLVAYVVQGSESSEQGFERAVVEPALDPRSLIHELRAFLKERLPAYMVPSDFVFLDVLPLTPNGKVDRAALGSLDVARLVPTDMDAAPRTPVEEILAGLWAETLGVDHVGIHDNFFELGGHSLLATQLVSQLQDLFPTDVPLLTLFFENPTVAGLGEALIQSQATTGDVDRIATILQSVVSLPEEELETMLLNEGTISTHDIRVYPG